MSPRGALVPNNLLTLLDPLGKILISMAIGAALVFLVSALVSRLVRRSLRWPQLVQAVSIAIGVTIIGLVVNFLTSPDPPPALLWPLGALTMPGVLAMNIFGRRSLEDLPYFGGFALNIVLLTTCAYAALRKFRRA
jgi:hypothetical protein